MKLTDMARQQYPDGAMTVEELFQNFVKKPSGKDEPLRLSAREVMERLGWKSDMRQQKRANAWLRKEGFRTWNDNYCWYVVLETPLVAPFVV